jgi:hypothetical protein
MAYSMYAFQPESKPRNFIAFPQTKSIFERKKDVSNFKIPYIVAALTTCALAAHSRKQLFSKELKQYICFCE